MGNSKWMTGNQEASPTREPLPHREALEITEKMGKGQAAFAEQYNQMRERLLLLGEMQSK